MRNPSWDDVPADLWWPLYHLADTNADIAEYLYSHHTCVMRGCDMLSNPGIDYCWKHGGSDEW